MATGKRDPVAAAAVIAAGGTPGSEGATPA
jgi:hypothetical protein